MNSIWEDFVSESKLLEMIESLDQWRVNYFQFPQRKLLVSIHGCTDDFLARIIHEEIKHSDLPFGREDSIVPSQCGTVTGPR